MKIFLGIFFWKKILILTRDENSLLDIHIQNHCLSILPFSSIFPHLFPVFLIFPFFEVLVIFRIIFPKSVLIRIKRILFKSEREIISASEKEEKSPFVPFPKRIVNLKVLIKPKTRSESRMCETNSEKQTF